MSDYLDKHIGFWSIFKTYGWKDFSKDSSVPALLALIVTVVAITFCNDSYALFDKIVSLCISILPSYLGLLVAAYTLLLTLLSTEAVTKLKGIVNDENGFRGKDLIMILNSDFAACVLITGFALFLSFLFSVICTLKIVFSYADTVNYLGIFLMLFLFFFQLQYWSA